MPLTAWGRLAMSAIARTRAFVSYSHADGRPVAEAVVAAVRSAGLDPWIDALIRPGENWQRAIEAELRATVAVVVVLTPRACASDEVMAEWSFALLKGVPVLPAVGLPCDPPYRLGQFQRIDWHGNPNAAALLTSELKRLAAEPPAASPPAGAAARPCPRSTRSSGWARSPTRPRSSTATANRPRSATS